MKKFRYILVFVIGLIAMSCTEQVVTPKNEGEDDPIVIPPPKK